LTLHNPLGLLLLLLIPIIILLHSIVTRRKKTVVSSVFLWRRLMKDHRRSLRLKRLMRNLNLILQILAVCILSVAFADPFLLREAEETNLILILDASASMKARNGRGTRYDAARTESLNAIDSLSDASQTMVIHARAKPVLLTPFTADKDLLRRLIRDSDATDEPGDLGSALIMAFSLSERERGDRILLVSDGAFDLPTGFDLQRERLRYIGVGEEAPNVGITRFRFRRTGDDYQAYIKITNPGAEPADITLQLELDGTPESVREVRIEPGQEEELIIPYEGILASTAAAVIREEDALKADNRAFTVLSQSSELSILLITGGNPFLEAMLDTLRGVDVEIRDDEELDEAQWGADHDIVIFDAVDPPPLEKGGFVLIERMAPGLPLTDAGILSYPQITGWSREHPILANLDLGNTVIAQAVRTQQGEGVGGLVRSGDSSLISAYESGSLRLVYIAFDLLKSDLPLRPAFPILMTNILSWLNPGRLSQDTQGIQAGQTISIPFGEDAAFLTKPDGSTEALETLEGRLSIQDTQQVGFYQVGSGKSRYQFAVNLLSGSESDIRPRFLQGAGSSGETEVGTRKQPVPVWPLLAAVAILLLLGEWYLWLRNR